MKIVALAFAAVALAGCSGITIRQPLSAAAIQAPHRPLASPGTTVRPAAPSADTGCHLRYHRKSYYADLAMDARSAQAPMAADRSRRHNGVVSCGGQSSERTIYAALTARAPG